MSILKRTKLWFISSRMMYTTTVLLPCCVGAAIAFHDGANVHIGAFLLILLGMMFANMGTNFANDYYDYKSGVDQLDEGRMYKKGSEALLTENQGMQGPHSNQSLYNFTPRSILISAFGCYAVTASVGLYFVLTVDWILLPYGIFGLLLGFFYTAPPLKFGYRRVLGDFICLVGSSVLPMNGTYYVFTHTTSMPTFIGSIIVGLLVATILYIANVPDADADKKVGKNTLSVMFGKKAVKYIAPMFYIAIFGLIIISVIIHLFPVLTLVSLLGLPFVFKIVKTTRKYFDDIHNYAPSIAMSVQTYTVSAVLLGLGFVIDKLI